MSNIIFKINFQEKLILYKNEKTDQYITHTRTSIIYVQIVIWSLCLFTLNSNVLFQYFHMSGNLFLPYANIQSTLLHYKGKFSSRIPFHNIYKYRDTKVLLIIVGRKQNKITIENKWDVAFLVTLFIMYSV